MIQRLNNFLHKQTRGRATTSRPLEASSSARLNYALVPSQLSFTTPHHTKQYRHVENTVRTVSTPSVVWYGRTKLARASQQLALSSWQTTQTVPETRDTVTASATTTNAGPGSVLIGYPGARSYPFGDFLRPLGSHNHRLLCTPRPIPPSARLISRDLNHRCHAAYTQLDARHAATGPNCLNLPSICQTSGVN